MFQLVLFLRTVLAISLCIAGVLAGARQYRFTRAFIQADFASATAIWPQNAEGWHRLAASEEQTAPAVAEQAASRAAADNPFDWTRWAELADLQIENDHLAAARISHSHLLQTSTGFDARWRYANFLLLTGDQRGFWATAADALASAPAGQIRPALDELLGVAGNQISPVAVLVQSVRSRLSPHDQTQLSVEFLKFLLEHSLLHDAAAFYDQLHLDPSARSEPEMHTIADRLLTAAVDARDIGDVQLITGHAAGIKTASVADCRWSLPFNFDTHLSSSASTFGWRMVSDDSSRYLLLTRSGLASSLAVQFDGTQPDAIDLAVQPVLTSASTIYELSTRSQADADTEGSGLQFEVRGPFGFVLTTVPLGSSYVPTWKTTTFSSGYRPDLVNIVLHYQRPEGSMPMRGSVSVTDAMLSIPPCTSAASLPVTMKQMK